MLKTIALFGSIGGGVFCLYFWVVYAIWGNPFLAEPKSFDFFIYLLAVAGSIAYYRYWAVGKGIGFLKGFWIGIGTTVVMVVVSISFVYIFTTSIAPDSLQAHIKERVAHSNKYKVEMITKWNEQISQLKENPDKITGQKLFDTRLLNFQQLDAMSMAFAELGKLLLGGIVSLVAAILLRK